MVLQDRSQSVEGYQGTATLADTEFCAKMTDIQQLDDIRLKAHQLCREYLRGTWRKVDPYQLVIKKISGGLSNLLYYVALPGGTEAEAETTPSRVLLRLYGQSHGENAMQGLIAESVVFTLLSASQRGPRLFGVFPGGRLEEYIPARPLQTSELGDSQLSRLIAQKAAQIHAMDVPISKEPRWLWDTMERWLSDIQTFQKQSPPVEEHADMISHVERYRLADELNWLRDFVQSVKSPVVFCHNDIQEGNILLRNSESIQSEDHPNEARILAPGDLKRTSADQLVVIDFEYCAYNYRAFDLANHLCEWVYDYSNENHPYFWARHSSYPTQTQMENFVISYLSTGSDSPSRGGAKPRPSEQEIQKLIHEIKAFTLCSHFFWGLWSVVNATSSKIHFDYWAYGKERFTQYLQRKASLCADRDRI